MNFDEKFWIAVAFFSFIALLFKTVKNVFSNILDSKLTEIKADLEEAKKLKAEAEEIFANYEKAQQEAEIRSKEIISNAEKITAKMLEDIRVEVAEYNKDRIQKIDKNIQKDRNYFLSQLRQKISDSAIDIVENYLINNREDIKDEAYRKSIEKLENATKN